MCTLTYRLSADGYQVFFNRDEQKTRPQAIAPAIHKDSRSIFPVDPTGGGTWIAVNEVGMTLALLNYYQAQVDPAAKEFVSRGTIIPQLLLNKADVSSQLIKMDLRRFQAFQLCCFDGQLSAQNNSNELATSYIWDGQRLTIASILQDKAQPITSSAVDFDRVERYRKQRFIEIVVGKSASTVDYIAFHQQQDKVGRFSVKMSREDAQTVSFSHIKVNVENSKRKVAFEYLDYVDAQQENKRLTLPW